MDAVNESKKEEKLEIQQEEPVNNEYIDKDARTVFVSNIHPQVTESDLDKLFSPFGNLISIDLLRVENNPLNKGRCFLEYSTPEEAQTAVKSSNGILEFKGKIMQTHYGLTSI